MERIRAMLVAGLAAVVGLVGASLLGVGDTAHAMPPTIFKVTITNMTDPPSPISPGVLVGHCTDGVLWAADGHASAALEAIAEVGDPSAALAADDEDSMMGSDDNFVQERHEIGAVEPGESVSVEVQFENGCKLSSAHMIVSSNDTFVGAQSVGMWDPDTHLPLDRVERDLMAYDAGTEENTEPGSGFEGGQPDPAHGADNVDNGTPTVDSHIALSDQYKGVQATLVIESVSDAMDGGDELDEGDDAMDEGDDSMGEDDESMGHDDESMGDDDGAMGDGEDTMAEHAPATGTGGLVGKGRGFSTYLLGLLTGLAAAIVVAGGLRLVRQRR